MVRVSQKWKNKSEIYRWFAEESYPYLTLDFSEEAMKEQYESETYGTKIHRMDNGFHVGKRLLDLTITSWSEDCNQGYISYAELKEDSLSKSEVYSTWFDSLPLAVFSQGPRSLYRNVNRDILDKKLGRKPLLKEGEKTFILEDENPYEYMLLRPSTVLRDKYIEYN